MSTSQQETEQERQRREKLEREQREQGTNVPPNTQPGQQQQQPGTPPRAPHKGGINE